MKKKTMLLPLAACMAAMLIGCGANTEDTAKSDDTDKTEIESEHTTDTETADTESTEAASQENTEATEENLSVNGIPAAYIPVLDGVYSFIVNYDSSDYSANYENPYYLEGLNESLSYADNPQEVLEREGYELRDINHDHVDELLIGSGSVIDALYTIRDNEAVLVEESWSRNMYSLMPDDTLFYQGSGGAAYTIFGIYRLERDSTELKAVDYYFSDYIDESQQEVGWYHNNTGSDEKSESTLTDMTSDEALHMIDRYSEECVTFNPTYFADYTPSN